MLQFKLKRFLSINPHHYLFVTLIISLFFTTVSNIALWRHFYKIVTNGDNLSLSFIITAPITIFLLMYAIFLILFSWKFVLKPACTLLFISCAGATYAAIQYGIIFDSDMLTNFLETNLNEAKSYISLYSIGAILILGVIPSILLWRFKVYYPNFIKSQLQRIAVTALVLVIAGISVIIYYQQYSFIGRNNRTLNKEILPVSYVHTTINYVKHRYFEKEMPYVAMGENAHKVTTTSKPKLMFLVLGETARAQNFSALGYNRNTNFYTNKENVISFANVSSCGTSTAYSVPCMFSNMPRKKYTAKRAENREGILDVLQKAGVNITWLDNDSGCKGVCDRVKNIRIEPTDKVHCDGSTCKDEIFLNYAKKLSENVKEDTLIAFHLIGSHGPRYYERYPKKFRKYTPDCNRPDVENCSLEEVRNAYDNTIAYTDYVIYELINILETHMKTNDTMLLYISDHGESLGENNLYLHGTPYAIAPKEQTRIPMQLWIPDKSADSMRLNKKCISEKAKLLNFSHDNFFHSLMGLLQVRSAEYRKNLDIFSSCFTKS